MVGAKICISSKTTSQKTLQVAVVIPLVSVPKAFHYESIKY